MPDVDKTRLQIHQPVVPYESVSPDAWNERVVVQEIDRVIPGQKTSEMPGVLYRKVSAGQVHEIICIRNLESIFKTFANGARQAPPTPVDLVSLFNKVNIRVIRNFKLRQITPLIDMDNNVGVKSCKAIDKLVKYAWLMMSQDNETDLHFSVLPSDRRIANCNHYGCNES